MGIKNDEILDDEILDPEHLSAEDLEKIRKLADARREGFDVAEDDPIERGLINGFAMRVIGETAVEEDKGRKKGVEWSKLKAGLSDVEVRYKHLCTQLSGLIDRMQRRRQELQRETGLTWVETYSHKDVVALDEELKPLRREMKELESHFIRANLERFGIEDMKVTGVLHYSANEKIPNGVRFHDGKEAGRAEMPLSDLCGMGYSGLAEKFSLDPEALSFDIVVERDGQKIGRVDCDRAFHYEASPDLRSALAWQIATDGGRKYLVEEKFDLDQASSSLLETIHFKGFSREAFFGPYFEVLRRVFVYKQTTRFGDGHCCCAGDLWRVATRELGEEHPGYQYCF